MVKKGVWKYVLNRYTGKELLYNLEDDPYEYQNLIGIDDFASIHQKLKDEIERWEKETPAFANQRPLRTPQWYYDYFMNWINSMHHVNLDMWPDRNGKVPQKLRGYEKSVDAYRKSGDKKYKKEFRNFQRDFKAFRVDIDKYMDKKYPGQIDKNFESRFHRMPAVHREK